MRKCLTVRVPLLICVVCALLGALSSAPGMVLADKWCELDGCNSGIDQLCLDGACSFCSGDDGVYDSTCVNTPGLVCVSDGDQVRCGYVVRGVCFEYWCINSSITANPCNQYCCQ